MDITPSQAKALSTERHLAILANAGSGKTAVLVKRYVDLFERFPELGTRNVAAITFTENAAGELRDRILKEINQRLTKLPISEIDRHARLRHLRENLRSAFIGTIHAFAARLLREYPVEANVDASFSIVTGADERLMREDAIQLACYSALDEAYTCAEENPILHFFRTVGRRPAVELIRTLLQNPRRAERIRSTLLAKDDPDILDCWREALKKALSIAFDENTKRFCEDALAYCKSTQEGTVLVASIETFKRSGSFFETAKNFGGLLDCLLTKNDTPRVKAIDLKNADRIFTADFESWLPLAVSIRSLLACFPSGEQEFLSQQKEYLNLMRAAFDLYDRVLEQYSSTKAEFGLLDFNDLIEKLILLLRDANVRSEIMGEIRFLMIDEYQDTDESQFELARILTDNFGRASNLAIVGDPKQAIYTFRNADAEVFGETLAAIERQELSNVARGESIAMNLLPREERGRLMLAESFRMALSPLAAINRIFRKQFQQDSQSNSELIHGRAASHIGRVEWIAIPKKNNDSLDASEEEAENDATESEMIARKILSIVRDQNYTVEQDGVLRPAKYEDIAILLRSRTSLALLERALAEAKIPYSIAKGAGFFIQQEILDIISYLSFLISPESDTAFAAILRSPFFALSDVELFKIAHHGGSIRHADGMPIGFWEKFQRYAETMRDPALMRVLEQLRENLALAGRTGTAFLMQKIYLETGIAASIQAGGQAEQKIANLEKFLSFARSSDAMGFSGLFDFVERVRYLSDAEEQESQADLPAEAGAVRIMTVHAAKGLEYPIVILPFLQQKFYFDHRNILDKELGVQIASSDGPSRSCIAELIHRRSQTKTIEEEKRILYVAMTRARDHLILCCSMPKNPPKERLEWICDALGTPDSERLSIEETVMHYDAASQKHFSELHRLDIPIIRSLSDIVVPETQTVEIETTKEFHLYLSPVTASRNVARFSATQLVTFHACPTKYFLSYTLGLPEELSVVREREPETSERLGGSMLGQIVHAVVERIDEIAPDGLVLKNPFQSSLSRILDSLEVSNNSERLAYANAARIHLETFLKSAMAERIRSAQVTRTECALETVLATGDTLFGIIDRLMLEHDGIWTVLDYKTDSVPNPSKHEFQMQCYAYLVHKLIPEAQTVRAILFFTATGEWKEFLFANSDFADFEREVQSRIEEIRRMEFLSDLQLLERNRSHCQECHFFQRNVVECIVLAAQNPTEIPAM